MLSDSYIFFIFNLFTFLYLETTYFLNPQSCKREWLEFLNTPSNDLRDYSKELSECLESMQYALTEQSLTIFATLLESKEVWKRNDNLRNWFQDIWLHSANVSTFVFDKDIWLHSADVSTFIFDKDIWLNSANISTFIFDKDICLHSANVSTFIIDKDICLHQGLHSANVSTFIFDKDICLDSAHVSTFVFDKDFISLTSCNGIFAKCSEITFGDHTVMSQDHTSIR